MIRAALFSLVIALAAAAPDPPADPVPAHESFTLESRALGEKRLIHVHVPVTASATPLPVLYMPDGGIDEDFPHVVNAVEALVRGGKTRPVIVVGIPNTQRRRDLTGPTEVASDRAIAPQVGGSAAFRRFIREELIPEIDRRYRTTSERGIVGESLAGLFVVETFLEEPSLFSHYVAIDPSLWWNKGALLQSAASRLRGFDASPRTLYLGASQDAEARGGPMQLSEVIRRAPPPGLQWHYEFRPDLTHATIFRGLEMEALEAALRSAPPPTPAAANLAAMEEIAFHDSHGARMNALMYRAAGAGPHPVALFLHGFPGNEKNLDLAQAVRRAGWDAIYFNYRGSWGSGGTFSFANALEDVSTALAWIRNPANASKYRLDPNRIALIGHSFGGWLALLTARKEPAPVCVSALAAWNVGWRSQHLSEPAQREEAMSDFRETTDPAGGPLRTSAEALFQEISAAPAEWDYLSAADSAKGRAVLLAAATRDTPDEDPAMHERLARAMRAAGGNVRRAIFEDDHPFSASRVRLAELLVQWLNGDCAKSQAQKRRASTEVGWPSFPPCDPVRCARPWRSTPECSTSNVWAATGP